MLFRSIALGLAGAGLLAATVAATTAPQVPRTAVHFTAAQMTLDSSHLGNLFALDDAATGSPSTEYTGPDIPIVSETPIDVAPPPPAGPGPCSPTITSAKGKLTSGGYIVLSGTCFGSSGSVAVSGFPNGDPKVTIAGWSPTLITVGLPSIDGVPDLTMHVKVTSGTQSSKTLDAKFTASMGSPVTLPTKYVANIECALYGACATAPHKPTGNHWDYSAQNGTDVWTLTLPDHFRLHSIHLVHVKTGPTKTTTVMASGNRVTFTVAWQENQQPNGSELGHTAQTTTYTCSSSLWPTVVADVDGVEECSVGGTMSTSTTGGNPVQIPTFNNVYQVEAMVVGPAGMTP